MKWRFYEQLLLVAEARESQMTFLLSTILRLHQSSSVYLHLHFIVCLPDFRYFSALIARESQEAEDQLYYQKRQLIIKWLLIINSADRKFPWNVNTEF